MGVLDKITDCDIDDIELRHIALGAALTAVPRAIFQVHAGLMAASASPGGLTASTAMLYVLSCNILTGLVPIALILLTALAARLAMRPVDLAIATLYALACAYFISTREFYLVGFAIVPPACLVAAAIEGGSRR